MYVSETYESVWGRPFPAKVYCEMISFWIIGRHGLLDA